MTQNEQIAAYLNAGNALTPLEALRMFGVARLAARVGELKSQGMAIDMNMIEVDGAHGRARVARYVLKGAGRGAN